MTHGAQNLTAVFFDEGGGTILQRAAEHIVRGYEEPSFAELRQSLPDRRPHLVGVVDPMNRVVWRARLAGEVGRSGAGEQHRLVVGLGDFQRRKAYRRIDQIGDRVYAIKVEPAARDSGADIGLVLVISGYNLDRYAVDLAAELLRRHLRGLDGTDA